MESKEGTTKNSTITSPPCVEKPDHYTSNKTSSPSSSSDYPSDDPTLNLHENSEEPISTETLTKYEPCDNGVSSATSPVAFTSQTTNSPPVMESPPPVGPSPTGKYRIPSSVFARSKSSTPVECSVCSNESLFSIHTGNMSFRNDPFFLRSGELGPPGEVYTSSQIFNCSQVQSPYGRDTETKFRLEDASIKEGIRESEDQKIERCMSVECMSHHSRESGTSGKSFAFPILAGEMDHCASERMTSPVKAAPEQHESSAKPPKRQEPESPTKPKPKTSTDAPKAAPVDRPNGILGSCASHSVSREEIAKINKELRGSIDKRFCNE